MNLDNKNAFCNLLSKGGEISETLGVHCGIALRAGRFWPGNN